MIEVINKKKKLFFPVIWVIFSMYFLLEFIFQEKYTYDSNPRIFWLILISTFLSFINFTRKLEPQMKLQFDDRVLRIQFNRDALEYEWEDVEKIWVEEKKSLMGLIKNAYISFDVKNPSKLNKMSTLVNGAHVSLPNRFGMKPDELVHLLQEYRAR